MIPKGLMFIFEIFGEPQVQKQTQWGKGRAYDPSKKYKESIQWQIKPYAPEKPILGPVQVTVTFYLPIPKSTSSVKRRQMLNHVILPDKRPDASNLYYIIENAMKEIVYVDDSQVVNLNVSKFYGEEPKTVIQVRPILTMEEVGLHHASN